MKIPTIKLDMGGKQVEINPLVFLIGAGMYLLGSPEFITLLPPLIAKLLPGALLSGGAVGVAYHMSPPSSSQAGQAATESKPLSDAKVIPQVCLAERAQAVAKVAGLDANKPSNDAVVEARRL